MDKSPDKFGSTTKLLGGGYAVDFAVQTSRKWQMRFPFDDTAWHQLQALYTWQYGPGPFAMLEPSITNYLAPNQASGTDARGDTIGFELVFAAGGSALNSSATYARTGSRSLRWTVPAASASGALLFKAPFGYTGFPTAVGLQWAFSSYWRAEGTDTSIDLQHHIVWYNGSGVVLSTSSGSTFTATTGTWTQGTATGTAPAGAVYAAPQVDLIPATVGAGTYVYMDSAQLQVGGAVTAWKPGEGLPIVSFADAPQEVVQWAAATPLGERRQIQITLAQLGVI